MDIISERMDELRHSFEHLTALSYIHLEYIDRLRVKDSKMVFNNILSVSILILNAWKHVWESIKTVTKRNK